MSAPTRLLTKSTNNFLTTTTNSFLLDMFEPLSLRPSSVRHRPSVIVRPSSVRRPSSSVSVRGRRSSSVTVVSVVVHRRPTSSDVVRRRRPSSSVVVRRRRPSVVRPRPSSSVRVPSVRRPSCARPSSVVRRSSSSVAVREKKNEINLGLGLLHLLIGLIRGRDFLSCIRGTKSLQS